MQLDKTIRRDLFAVKVWDSAVGDSGGWVYNEICRDITTAKNYLSAARHEQISLGSPRLAKLVHPAQFVVNAYILAGNVIR